MNCKNCGRQNPSGSLYCQDCGHRLGDWVPQERPQKMPTPPTGIARQREGAPVGPAMQVCPRCASTNASHMRFCNNCGFELAGMPIGSGGAPIGSAPQGAPMMSPYAFSPAPLASSGPVCWRCRAGGDAGAEFCKFCGARYAEDPSRGVFAGSSVGSALGAYAAAPANGHG
ncbi:MAG: zinc ribbon domain-containing protein, partial [Myxococcota bacterium]|nr:zinc ribbon domain-containing protein [Myxococcota bacterium]